MHDASRLRLDVPEHGQLQLPLAGIGARSLAALVDVALLALALLAVALMLVGGAVAGVVSGEAGLPIGAALVAIVPVLGPLLFELLMAGQSPGKRLLSLRVISADGSPAAATQILLRNVLRLIDLLPVGYLIGIIAAFASTRTQRLGDMVAGTVVIRESLQVPTTIHDGGIPIPQSLHGVPAAVFRAAQLLADPSRQLPEPVLRRRRSELAAIVRQHRPDLAHASDAELWAQLQATTNP